MKTDKIRTEKADTGTNSGKVYAQVEKAQAHTAPTASPEEAAERRATRQTRGKKGAVMKRATIAFSDPCYNYLFVMSHIRGQGIAAFLNDLITDDMERNADVYEQAKKLVEGMRK